MSRLTQPDIEGEVSGLITAPGDNTLLIHLSEGEMIREDDVLRGYIAKGRLTHEIIRGVIRTYLAPESVMTKTEIALSFGIRQTLPSTIMGGFYEIGGRFEMGNGPEAEDFIDALIDWIS